MGKLFDELEFAIAISTGIAKAATLDSLVMVASQSGRLLYSLGVSMMLGLSMIRQLATT